MEVSRQYAVQFPDLTHYDAWRDLTHSRMMTFWPGHSRMFNLFTDGHSEWEVLSENTQWRIYMRYKRMHIKWGKKNPTCFEIFEMPCPEYILKFVRDHKDKCNCYDGQDPHTDMRCCLCDPNLFHMLETRDKDEDKDHVADEAAPDHVVDEDHVADEAAFETEPNHVADAAAFETEPDHVADEDHVVDDAAPDHVADEDDDAAPEHVADEAAPEHVADEAAPDHVVDKDHVADDAAPDHVADEAEPDHVSEPDADKMITAPLIATPVKRPREDGEEESPLKRRFSIDDDEEPDWRTFEIDFDVHVGDIFANPGVPAQIVVEPVAAPAAHVGDRIGALLNAAANVNDDDYVPPPPPVEDAPVEDAPVADAPVEDAPVADEPAPKPKRAKVAGSASEYFAFHNKALAVDSALYQGPTFKVSGLRFPAELKLAFIQDRNPKQVGSAAHGRYELYKYATTLAQFAALSESRWSALQYDYQHGFVLVG